MPPHVNRRMPSSCEPCRRRKIRCYGTHVPCDTCVRRGRASGCCYQRDTVASSTPVPSSAPSTAQSNDTGLLMHKISHLEGLLRDHINMTTPTHRQYQPIQGASPLLSPPQDAAQSSSIEGGRLTQSPSGHVRYVSQASVLESTGWPAVTDVHQSSPTSLFNFPFSADPATSRQQLLDLLPPMSLCDRLKDLYMAVFSPLFHILHEPSFEESYRRFREDPATTSLTFLALLFVIFAIATMAVADDDPLLDDLGHEPSPRSKVKRIGAKFQSSSMKCLAADGFMWQHNLDTVKTLVLIIYSFSHTSGSAWSLLGATLNIAVAVGCHVDPIRLGTSITIVQAEERRRCWAALRMLYTIQNACLGNIAPVQISSDVKLPADLDDDELDHVSGQATRASLRRVPSKMAYILHKFTLYELASRICQLPMPWLDIDYARISSLDQELEMEKKTQSHKFDHLQDLPTYHQAHWHILTIYTNHLFVILHRPCIHPTAILSEAQRLKSLRRCMQAATQVLSSHNTLCTEETFKPYTWYAQGLGAFYALLAAASLTVVAGDPVLHGEVAVGAIAQLLETCLQRFRELAHRSDTCLRGQQLLEKELYEHLAQSPQRHQAESLGDSQGHDGTPGQSEIMGLGGRDGLHSRRETLGQKPAIGFDGSSASLTGSLATEADGWNVNLDLLNFVSNTPLQHWLSPTAFTWDQWVFND